MEISRPPSAADVEDLLRARWYDIDAHHARLILNVVRGLSDRELANRPHLLSGAVIATDLVGAELDVPGDRAALLERFSNVANAAALVPGAGRESAQWLVIRMIAARWKGDLGQALALSDQLAHVKNVNSVRQAILDEDYEQDRPGQVALQRGLTVLLAGRTRTAMTLFTEAYRASGRPPFRHFTAANSAANAAMLAAIEGYDKVAQDWLARIEDVDALPQWCRGLISLGAAIATTVLATDVRDLDAAAGFASKLGNASERFELWPFQIYALTEYDLARNEPALAYKRLMQVGFERDLTIATEPIADHIVFRAYLDTLIAKGEGGLVLRLAEDAGTPVRALIPIARTRLLAGDHVGAARVAARAMHVAQIPKRDMWEATIIHAIARMHQGEKDAALHSFGLITASRPRCLPAVLGRQQSRDVQDLYALAGLLPPELTMHSDLMPREITSLTQRERHVLQHLANGLTAAQIAAADVTSEHTVRTHMKRIYRKLRVSTREAAIAEATQQGIVR